VGQAGEPWVSRKIEIPATFEACHTSIIESTAPQSKGQATKQSVTDRAALGGRGMEKW